MRSVLQLTVVLVALVTASPVSASTYAIHAETWARPRSGDVLLSMPVLRQVLEDFERNAGAVIEIRYPGGEEGILWARELQDWLVALGVPSARIRAASGSGTEDSVELVIKRADDD